MHRLLPGSTVLLLLLALAACAPPPAEPPDLSAESEAAVRAASEAWAAAARAKDAEAFAALYDDGAVLMMEGAPDVRGAALRDAIAGMMQDPAFSLEFGADQVVAARSGELAYETGSYEMTFSGPDGEPMTQNGHYVAIWTKQSDGSWTCVVDAPVSDPPASEG